MNHVTANLDSTDTVRESVLKVHSGDLTTAFQQKITDNVLLLSF